MGRRTLFLVVACLVLLVSMETAHVVGDTSGKDDKGVTEKDNKGVKNQDAAKAMKEKNDAKAKKEAEAKAKKEAEAKAKKEREDAKAKKDAEAKAKKEKEDAKAKKDAEAKAKKEAEAKAKKEKEDAKAKKDAEAKANAKAKKEAEAKAKKKREDAKAKKDAEAKAKKEKEDAKAKKDAEAKAKKEAEAKAKKEKEDAKAKKDAEAKAKQEKQDAKATAQYAALAPKNGSTSERAYCKTQGRCNKVTLECPQQCPERKPKNNNTKVKSCFIDCSSKCETTCKYRKPKCNGYGSICYDPRFIGGDGVMFYFHGATGGDFALVSDDDFQINAHFIGTRPEGRTRDYTWVQALSVMFGSHNLVIAAKKVAHWDDGVDDLIVRWDGERVAIPTVGEAEWRTNGDGRDILVERTVEANSVRVVVTGLVEMYVKVTPIGAEENKAHNYQLPSNDAFAHLETQFKFANLTDSVEGVLGKTYKPDYISPVKIGVPMPMMGGEDKYRTLSLLSPTCKSCRYDAMPSAATYIKEVVEH